MSHLKDLTKQFSNVKDFDTRTRIKLVLEMIEYYVTYPPPEIIEEWEVATVDGCVKRVLSELESQKEHLFAHRINKIWEKRDHLLQLAENAHNVKHDYMDDLEYHEEIMWIRTTIEEYSEKAKS